MGLPSRFMKLLLPISPRPAPRLPPWIRHNTRGGTLVSHGDCRHQDNLGVPLCFRVLASAANSISSVSARPPQYFPVPARTGCQRQHHPWSSAGKDMLHNDSARPQGWRLFSTKFDPPIATPDVLNEVPESICSVLTELEHMVALDENHKEKMLRCLEKLKGFAGDKLKEYYEIKYNAKYFLSTVVSPLGDDQLDKNGGVLDDGVVKESLEVIRLFLDNASEAIRTELCEKVKLKHIIERIIGDYGGSNSADHELIHQLAEQILAKLPSTPK